MTTSNVAESEPRLFSAVILKFPVSTFSASWRVKVANLSEFTTSHRPPCSRTSPSFTHVIFGAGCPLIGTRSLMLWPLLKVIVSYNLADDLILAGSVNKNNNQYWIFLNLWRRVIVVTNFMIHSLLALSRNNYFRFSSNSEANASVLLENPEELLLHT